MQSPPPIPQVQQVQAFPLQILSPQARYPLQRAPLQGFSLQQSCAYALLAS